MSFMSEFREFAVKGSVVDLAVGVIIGGAFGKIVDSLVKDLIMPIVGALFGGLDPERFAALDHNPTAQLTELSDDALARAAVDLGGRAHSELKLEHDPGMAAHMLSSLAQAARASRIGSTPCRHDDIGPPDGGRR